MTHRDTVQVTRADLGQLVMAADVVREHHKTLLDTTPSIVGLDTLLVLEEAGIIDADTLDVTAAFDAALVRCGRALGTTKSESPEL